MMMSQFDLTMLIEDLEPVRVVKPHESMLQILGATLVASLGVAMIYGVRADVIAGNPHPVVIIRAGLLLLLGFATTLAVAAAARPSVGKAHNGWIWALAAAALFPFAALCQFVYLFAVGQPLEMFMIDFEYGVRCLTISCISALWIGTCLTLWLRRGAPIALNRAGWLVGLAAGSFGTFSFNIHCSSVNVFYIGLWYSLATVICAIAGRLVVPRIVRW